MYVFPSLSSSHLADGSTSVQELVWSGASAFRNRRVYDFKVASIDGSDHITFVAPTTHNGSVFSSGAAFIYDSSYQQILNVSDRAITQDMHEFTVLNNGESALVAMIYQRNTREHTFPWKGTLLDCGFREINLREGGTSFEWYPSNHIAPSESVTRMPPAGTLWDWL